MNFRLCSRLVGRAAPALAALCWLSSTASAQQRPRTVPVDLVVFDDGTIAIKAPSNISANCPSLATSFATQALGGRLSHRVTIESLYSGDQSAAAFLALADDASGTPSPTPCDLNWGSLLLSNGVSSRSATAPTRAGTTTNSPFVVLGRQSLFAPWYTMVIPSALRPLIQWLNTARTSEQSCSLRQGAQGTCTISWVEGPFNRVSSQWMSVESAAFDRATWRRAEAELQLQGNARWVAPLEACEMGESDQAFVLNAGARSQSITLRSECALTALRPTVDSQRVQVVVDAAGADTAIDAALTRTSSGEVTLALVELPPTLTGSRWRVLRHDGRTIGTFAARVAARPTVSSMQVSYSAPDLDSLGGGPSARDEGGFVATVDRSWRFLDADSPHRPDYGVANTAILSQPPLPAGGRFHWRIRSQRPSVRLISWLRHGETCPDLNPNYRDADQPRLVPKRDCIVPTSEWVDVETNRVRFQALSSSTAALQVELGLFAVDAARNSLPITSIPVVLASRARIESIPLRIERYLTLDCGSTWPDTRLIRSGEIRAPVDHNSCALRFENPAMAEVQLDRLPAWRLALYGPQAIAVETRPAGQASGEVQQWVVDPIGAVTTTARSAPESQPTAQRQSSNWSRSTRLSEIPAEFRFRLNRSQSSDNDEVRIIARTHVLGTSEVSYRQGATVTSTTASGSGFEFSVLLRSRGTFGWPIPVRTYLTAPIAVTSIRLPASPINLPSSSSPSLVEVETLRGGLLFVVEPWNYNLRRNCLWFLPLRANVGMYFVNSNFGAFVPSFVAGGSLTLPMDTPTGPLSSQLSLSFLAERDFRPGGSWSFLMTMSADILSLFTPTVKAPSTTN